MDYIIRKLKKTSKLHNPKTNHGSEKRLSNYVIWKLITSLKKDFQITYSRILHRGIFGNTKTFRAERRIYGGARRNSPNFNGYFYPKNFVKKTGCKE